MTSVGKPRRARVDPALAVPVVGDGSLAQPEVADGRFVPVLILDTSRRPDVAEMIRVHGHVEGPGDVRCQWATMKPPDGVALHLTFERPVDLEMYVPFSVEPQAVLVEGILRAGAVWIQAGESGDVPSRTLGVPRLLVEVPETGFRSYWDDFLLDQLTRAIARDTGLPRRKARPYAVEVISQLAEIAALRMRSDGPAGGN